MAVHYFETLTFCIRNEYACACSYGLEVLLYHAFFGCDLNERIAVVLQKQ